MNWKWRLQQILLAFCAAAAVTKFWPSDRWPLAAALSYFPAPILFITIVSLLIWTHRKAILSAFLCLALAGTFYLENQRLFADRLPAKPESIRILHWNVWGARRGPQAVATIIAAQHPDIICLNEPKASRQERFYPPYPELLGGNWHSWTESFMAILSRFPMQKLQVFEGTGYQALLARIESPTPITVLLLDVSPRLSPSRRKIFEDLRHQLSTLPKPPDILVGDFNTPSLSFSLTPLAQMGYSDCYQLAGSGISYTWPLFFPMLRIDILLAHSSWKVQRHEIGFSTLSDHGWQWAEIYRPGDSLER